MDGWVDNRAWPVFFATILLVCFRGRCRPEVNEAASMCSVAVFQQFGSRNVSRLVLPAVQHRGFETSVADSCAGWMTRGDVESMALQASPREETLAVTPPEYGSEFLTEKS